MDLLSFVDKLTPILVVIIPSYFSFRGTQNSKETDKKIQVLSAEIGDLKEAVVGVQDRASTGAAFSTAGKFKKSTETGLDYPA